MPDTKILVIDDDRKIADSLQRILSYDGYTVKAAGDGPAGLSIMESFHPELVILDVVMPGLSGLEVCRRLKEAHPVPVLFLSARDEVDDRVRGLDSGGDDYLVKPFAAEELLARVRALLRRPGAPPAAAILHLDDLALDTDTRSALRNGRHIDLSATEYQLLLYFMANPHRVLTKEMILAAVWDYDFQGESNIVEVYVRYLRAKIEQEGESRLIHTVRGSGYILKETDQ